MNAQRQKIAEAAASLRASVHPLPRGHRKRRLPGVTLSLGFVLWITLAVAGSPYYRLSLAERLYHPWHDWLKPNGQIGLIYGFAGTFLLLLLLAYSIRKRWRFLARLGHLRRWLNVHIFCGLFGPALITLHAGFRIHGLIAVGYWSMIGVMASGFVGYYLYSQIPRALSGIALESDGLQSEIDALDHQLIRMHGLTESQILALRKTAGVERAAHSGPVTSLLFLLFQDVTFGLRLRRIPGLRQLGREEKRRLRTLVRTRMLVERRRAFLHQTETLFGYWHAIHKPFAILLFAMMAVHIGVAIWLGYAWAW